MRINNYISSTGLCSRREADKLIEAGHVKINNQIAVIGQHVNQGDVVEVKGEILKPKEQFIYIALNKPKGITSTTEKHIRNNIVDFVNMDQRIFPIGRLDKDSEGLILLTNDGSIVNQILAKENNHEKDYIVKVNKPITKSFLSGMANGVKIYNPVKNEYTTTNKSKVVKIDAKTFQITLTQGLNRQIRRMVSHFGYQVTFLQRIRIMNIHLNNLKVGKWRYLSPQELSELKEQIK
ncbi:MAG TPA: pseudouridine synthase [Erysipelothrix sp.]|nr:pseudouridine synthase [Erysipelothrix sp.]